MILIRKPLALALLLLATQPAWAQETTTEEPGNTAVGTAEANDFPLGEDPNAPATTEDVAIGQPYIRETFGDWALRCLKGEAGIDPCQLYQLLLDDNNNAVAEVSIFPLPEGGQAVAGATIVAPLETLLTQQLTITIDGGEARRYPFTFCNTAGCVARVGFTAQEVNLFKRGSRAILRMVPAAAPDEEVLLTLSLRGFTAGFEFSGTQQEN